MKTIKKRLIPHTPYSMAYQQDQQHHHSAVKVEDQMTGLVAPTTVLKDEDGTTALQEQKMQIDAANNPFVAKFTQLWFACYFERRLTRSKVENADLLAIVADLRKFFASDGAKVDFRRAVPLLQGLNVLFSRKMSFLVRDSE